MFRAYHLSRAHARRLPSQRRGFIADAFLELATALPYPASWPPYSTTIIIGTVLIRIGILPVAIWGNNRMIRYQKYVEPALREMRPQVSHQVLSAMRKEKFQGDKEAWKKAFSERIKPVLKSHQRELCIEHKCQQLPTTILPAVVQLAVFLPSSWFLAHLATDPFSSFDSESFMSLTRLSSEDESLGFPIALGLVTMANVESSTWFMTADEREALRVQEAKRQEKGEFTLPVGKVIKFALRGVSVVRIIIASQVSGAVVIYWVTSAVFGLFQTWWMEYRRRTQLNTVRQQRASSILKSDTPSPKILKQTQKWCAHFWLHE
ncbi:hypothetical protein BDZ89DRAFT_938575 [Hymenopellis radicata]|nr:hypothetical protein BDZ89DRAFT_938575 [Hymenopellis radicata]